MTAPAIAARPRRAGSERPASPPGCRVAASPRPHAARSAADAATTPAPAPRLPRRRATAPQWPPWPRCRPNPAGRPSRSSPPAPASACPAARQALLAHEKNGTATRIKGSRPGIADTWTPAAPLGRRPHDLRHAAVSVWLNSGVPATEVARRAGHGVAVLLKIYAHCIDGQANAANQRITRRPQHPRGRAGPRRRGRRRQRAGQPEVAGHRPGGGRDGQRNRSHPRRPCPVRGFQGSRNPGATDA